MAETRSGFWAGSGRALAIGGFVFLVNGPVFAGLAALGVGPWDQVIKAIEDAFTFACGATAGAWIVSNK